MPLPAHHRKRRPQGPNKNELKVSRGEIADQQRTRAGTLRERFPRVQQLELDLRMETSSGAVLEQVRRMIDADEALLLDIPCQGGCGNGLFLLKDAVESVLQEGKEIREGLGVCQAVSYSDPKVPCNTKLYYRIEVKY